MIRFVGPRLFLCALVALSAPAGAQSSSNAPTDQSPAAQSQSVAPNNPPTADDICRAVEQDAAANGLPVEFFAHVILQESRFNAQAVSPKAAQGIAQFMPQTADWRGFAAQNIAPRRICFASSCPGSFAASDRPMRSGGSHRRLPPGRRADDVYPTRRLSY
jgi:hypothetical protein